LSTHRKEKPLERIQVPDQIEQLIAYHEMSKHRFDRYAPGPGRMDWASQPRPFRRYEGAPFMRLPWIPLEESPSYGDAFVEGRILPSSLDLHSLSRLLQDSLALSAWKRSGTVSWALRVNPSSGNLHPTEGYVLCGPLHGLDERPVVCHYAPFDHGLEIRTRLPRKLWDSLSGGRPDQAFVGLTSIQWRESWKYGERAYRYCALDAGHAVGAVAIAAAGLGWKAKLMDRLGTEELARLLGVVDFQDVEPEEAECLLRIFPGRKELAPLSTDLTGLEALSWLGRPDGLSPSHVRWKGIEEATRACIKPAGTKMSGLSSSIARPAPKKTGSPYLRRVIHQRRTALAMDGVTSMPRTRFYEMLIRTLPGGIPFSVLPWSPKVHLTLFVHRVDDLPSGLYFLLRRGDQKLVLQKALEPQFLWEKPEECPETLELYLLKEGDFRRESMALSCYQDIAGDSCFSVAMIAEFLEPLETLGSWFYPMLYWECGMVGQVLYLEAEAVGLRGTGIGCYSDDPTHQLLGLKGRDYQDLYHFAVGGAVEDPRLTTLPPYPALSP
jgi:SagB-type dehydrogenase family enzyme